MFAGLMGNSPRAPRLARTSELMEAHAARWLGGSGRNRLCQAGYSQSHISYQFGMDFFPMTSILKLRPLNHVFCQSIILYEIEAKPGNGLNSSGTMNTATDLSSIRQNRSPRKCSNDQWKPIL